jgi:transglutaminase-like putative cysteine protease
VSGPTRLNVVAALAALLSMLPLVPITASNAWLVPATVAIILVALTGVWLRRIRIPRGFVPLIQLAVLTLWLGVMVASDVAWLVIIPTTEWVERLAVVVGEGWDAIFEYGAPVPVDRGIQFMLVAGAGLVMIAVDLAVYGLRRVPLAGPALAVMYAIAASVAREGWSWVWFVPPAVAFLALLVADGRNRVTLWGRSAGPSARHAGLPETDSLARNGRRVGAVAIAAAVVVPAGLPALTDGFVGTGGGSGSGGGRTIRTDNPIVDLRRDLVRPDNVPMLRYVTDAEQPEYIRTATLDVFDGEKWDLSQRDVPESQRIDDGLPWPPGLRLADDESPVATYDVEVSDSFGSSWLPLAYPAQTIDIEGDWRFDRATLDVVSPDHDVKGISYQVTSLVVDRDAATLREASRVDREEFRAMLELPDGMREDLEEYLIEAVGEATNPHEEAAALQAWFRSDGGFEYSLDPGPGTSASHLFDFLTGRIGYCEQYAATMAIMARALGIPARVAVGFTPGELLDDGSRLIRAHDAHAWPELYFEESGWVRFEPTPSRRTGTAPAWTLPPRDDPDDESGAGAGGEGAPDLPNELDEGAFGDVPFDDGLGGGGPLDQPSRWPFVLLGVAGLAALLNLPQGVAWLLRRGRWQRASGDPVGEAERAWADFRDAVRDAGLQWDPSDTPRGACRRVSRQVTLPTAGTELVDHVVVTTERARYAAHADAVPGLRHDAALLRRLILSTRSIRRKVRAWLWPSIVSDLLAAGSRAVTDGLTWVDSGGEQLRGRIARVIPSRR